MLTDFENSFTVGNSNGAVKFREFLANVCYILSPVRLSVVYNVRAPYSGDWNFRQCFCAVWYLGHLWNFDKNFTDIVAGNWGLNRRGVAKHSEQCLQAYGFP